MPMTISGDKNELFLQSRSWCADKKLYENTAVLEKARPPNCALAKFGILYQSWDMLKGR